MKLDHAPANITVEVGPVAARLRVRWNEVARQLGADENLADKMFNVLEKAYTQPHRHHHNLDHLADVLDEIDRAGAGTVKDPAALQVAAFFHDAVYDVRRDDNERRSALAAIRALLRFGAPKKRILSVRDMILCTREHKCVQPDGRILIDADLAILAAPAPRYKAYAEAIRKEYAHVPEDQYRRARSQLLNDLLRRPQLFQTMHGRRTHEAAARQNIAREVAELLSARPRAKPDTMAAPGPAAPEAAPADANGEVPQP